MGSFFLSANCTFFFIVLSHSALNATAAWSALLLLYFIHNHMIIISFKFKAHIALQKYI